MDKPTTPTDPVAPQMPVPTQPQATPAVQPVLLQGATPPPVASPPPIAPAPVNPPQPPLMPPPTPPVINTPPSLPPTAPPQPPAEPPAPRKSWLARLRPVASVLAFIVGIVLAATLINMFIFQSYYVDGTSMTPTLQNNDRLIIDKVEKTAATLQGKSYIPKRGQIVVLDSSLVDRYGHSEQLIKRVIGLPGETVVIDGGTVMVKNDEYPDGFRVDDELGLALDTTYTDSPIDTKVPEHHIFVLGDNRGPGGSFDSRAFGAVDSQKIQGRLLARLFPLNKTGLF